MTKHDTIGICNLTIHQNGHQACKGSTLLKETVKYHFIILRIFTEGRYYSVLHYRGKLQLTCFYSSVDRDLHSYYTFDTTQGSTRVGKNREGGIRVG